MGTAGIDRRIISWHHSQLERLGSPIRDTSSTSSVLLSRLNCWLFTYLLTSFLQNQRFDITICLWWLAAKFFARGWIFLDQPQIPHDLPNADDSFFSRSRHILSPVPPDIDRKEIHIERVLGTVVILVWPAWYSLHLLLLETLRSL